MARPRVETSRRWRCTRRERAWTCRSPALQLDAAPAVSRVALLGADCTGLKPALLVEPGAHVRRGQPVIADKSSPGVQLTAPAALFVTATDTRPHAPPPSLVIAERAEAFRIGLAALARLVQPVYLCVAPDVSIDAPPGVRVETFSGPHPAGNAGWHIHRLLPVHAGRSVWHVGYQDVVAIGHLLATGELDVSRVISLAGPGIARARLLRTRIGASTDEIVAGELRDGEQRVISGSVLDGRAARPRAISAGTTCSVVLAKEVFGGTGMNFVNPALAARAFLFFAYPAEISGDKVWTAVPDSAAVDGFSGATLLAQLRVLAGPFEDAGFSWWNAFVGLEPGSMGETSALACLAGAMLLLVTKIASWRTMAGVALGTIAMALGVLFKPPCLRGSCGGPKMLGTGGEPLSCAGCPNRNAR